ncbi:TIGR01212 family radical SAM protein [bacterium]|nr:TIGR01212 family radical SAM protein [bacterium]
MSQLYSYSQYLQNTFGAKTYKIVVASGLTCPTRDGSIAKAGCAFCDVRGSSSFFGKQGRGKSVADQIQKRIPEVRERFGAQKFLAYFQSYTNTYSDIDYLRTIYEAALTHPEVAGLCIGTRPDCIPDPVIDLLEELAERRYVSLELGVQSFEDPTLLWLERGHDGQSSIDALNRLKERAPHVHTCAHLMFGSPPDSRTNPRDSALLLNQLGVKGVKLHQLMILENTELARRWKEKAFHTLSLEEYAEQVLEFVEHLDPSIYLERLCAQATHVDECLAPVWSRERWHPHNVLRSTLEKNGCVQGSKIRNPSSLPA